MIKKRFVVYNSFSQNPFEGNSAAVFPDADDISDTQMQQIARQMNLVESVFIQKPASNDSFCSMRYFTPSKELPITGHPTIAAWTYLRDDMKLPLGKNHFKQETKAGVIDIKLVNGMIFCSQISPKIRIIDGSAQENIALTLHLDVSDIRNDVPVAMVDAGLGHLIVPIKNLESIMKLHFIPEDLKKLCESMGCRELQVFCEQTYQDDYNAHTRNLCPRYGVEDTACGNGNAALGGYFAHIFNPDKKECSYTFEQGFSTGSPASIYVLTSKSSDTTSVMIGGHAVRMVEGEIII